MDSESTKQRLNAATFALEAYRKLPTTIGYHRAYALTPDAERVLGVLAAAMCQRRVAEGRTDLDGVPPSSHQEFFNIIEALSQAGVNVIQNRPGDAPPLPKPWVDPVTNELLDNPWRTKDLKAQSLLAQRDPSLAAHYRAMALDPYGTIARMQD